ncbi:hypothetical protein [Serratia liquefaciens]|uniref:hypothetical protein n=1 Tax=Serratia liquefaciens TaxID=614 RepID=UPI0037F55AF3
MIRSKFMCHVTAGCMTGMVMLLTACSVGKNERRAVQPVPAVTPTTVKDSAVSSGNARLNPVALCQKTLDSLQVVNPSAWKRHKEEFDTLIRSASQYGEVRDGVSDKTKDTVDAMYQFRTSKICSDIENEVMDALITRGEKAAR